jgi:hypothetical protein
MPNQSLAGVMSTFDFMKQFSMFATLAAASGGSALSRWTLAIALTK